MKAMFKNININGPQCQDTMHGSLTGSGLSCRGSVLILVLWMLVMISFLASEYVAHNRRKSTIVMHTLDRFKRDNAARSLLTLLASEKYNFIKTQADSSRDKKTLGKSATAAPVPEAGAQGGGDQGSWMRIIVGGLEVFVKVEKESSKTQLALGGENNIRTTLKSIYGEDREKDADVFADAMLDWIDADDLVRLNGAEKDYYNKLYPPCNPGNGAFKTMSQIFLVKDFEPMIFWGDAVDYLDWMPWVQGDFSLTDRTYTASSSKKDTAGKDPSGKDSQGKTLLIGNERKKSLLEEFTIYPKEYSRISMLFPQGNDRYYNEIFFVVKEGSYFKVVEQLSRVLTAKSSEE